MLARAPKMIFYCYLVKYQGFNLTNRTVLYEESCAVVVVHFVLCSGMGRGGGEGRVLMEKCPQNFMTSPIPTEK